MTLPARWSLGVAALALAATAALTFVGASVSRTDPRPQATGAAAPAPRPGVLRTAGSPPTAPATGSASVALLARADDGPDADRVTRGPRQSRMEAALRPLLIEPRLRAGVFGLDMESG